MLHIFAIVAGADGINFNSRFISITNNSQTTLKTTNERIDTDFSSFDQRYNLDLSKSLFPYLSFAAGTFYQLSDTTTTSQNLESDTSQARLSPFLELNLNNPYFKAGLAYRDTRVEDKSTGLEKTRTDREQYTATMGMPELGLIPRWNMIYTRSIQTDDPETLDQLNDLLNFNTQYRLWHDLELNYAYTLNQTENRLDDTTTTEQNHFGRIAYTHSFLANRLYLNTSYSINYNTLEVPATTTVDTPLLRSAGLSSVDATPQDGPALVTTPALIDGDLTASAGLDIGLGGDESTFTNIGLDFGFAVDVNVIRIWVDRRLTNQVANSFSWSIYTSPDNLDTSTWTLAATVAPAPFGVFDNRFEITFPSVNTRYIKVVVRPLLPTVPGASSFANIFVTEMEALTSKSGVAITKESTNVNHNFNFNLRGRLSERTTLGYNLFYSLRTEDPDDQERDQMTNGLYLNHRFNDTYSASANVQRTDESEPNDTSVDYVYNASLRAAWLKNLNQILSYGRRTTSDQEGDSFQNSVLLRTNAILYRGWDAFVDLGYSWDELADGTRNTSRSIKSGTNIVPFDKLTFNLNYTYKETDQQDSVSDTLTETQIDLQGYYVPFTNLSLFAKISIVDKPTFSDTYQNYAINWSPFAQGNLQFFFNYNEVLRSESNQTETTFGPSARWTITRNLTLNLSYSLSTLENAVLKTDSESFSAEVKLHL